MATRLDRLLDSLNPSYTIDEINRRADAALESFQLKPVRLIQWTEFQCWFVCLCRHIEGGILGLQGGTPDSGLDFDWGRFVSILTKAFGSEGPKAAFEIARMNCEAGVTGLARRIAQVLADQHIQNQIEELVWQYWNSLSVDEKLAAADLYLAKYGFLLPRELTEGSAARVRDHLPQFLMEHPRLVERLHRIGR